MLQLYYMDPEVKRQLEEIHALAKDNHHLLRAVRRHQLLIDFGKIFLLLIVAGVVVYGYYVYLKPLAGRYSAGSATTSTAFFNLSSADIQKLIDSYKARQ